MMQLAIDTNVFLRFLLKDVSSQHEQAKELFDKAKKGKIKLIVPQIVVFEIVFALTKYYFVSKEETISKMKTLLTTEYFQVQDKEILIPALDLFTTSNLSFPDCFLVSYAKSKEAQVFTFDKKISQNL